jgi:hypothetical protein
MADFKLLIFLEAVRTLSENGVGKKAKKTGGGLETLAGF